MVDDSELDYIRTFCGEVMTGYTIKHYSEIRRLAKINDTQRGLVHPGELLIADNVYYRKRYKLELSDTTEAAINTGMKNLIAGIKKYNRRQTGPTQVASMSHIALVLGNKASEVGTTKRWKMEVNLDIAWSVG